MLLKISQALAASAPAVGWPCYPIADDIPGLSSPWEKLSNRRAEVRAEQIQTVIHSEPQVKTQPGTIDPLYLFACYMAWEQQEEPIAGWELLAATRSSDADTRAQARELLAGSKHMAGSGSGIASKVRRPRKRQTEEENEMKAPYGLEIVENCAECPLIQPGFFCEFSQSVLASLNEVSHRSTLPAGAILYVEGQEPRGLFIVCSGRVNLSTTSKEGKILILKTAEAGEALGLSAAISGVTYETTAETATPCQLNFVDRKHFAELMNLHGEIGAHAADCLSRDYQTAYRDIHHLVLTRSSAGKLARLLLSQSPKTGMLGPETHLPNPMTHEEMAQRIGSSRETVTRLLSDLRRRQLIRVDGATVVIRDRTALEALTV